MIRRRTITSYVWNSVSGNKMVILSNCIRNFFRKFELIGNSVQGENPAPENPQEIKSAGKWNEETQKYEVDVKVTGKNLFDQSKLISGFINITTGAFEESANTSFANSLILDKPILLKSGQTLVTSVDNKYVQNFLRYRTYRKDGTFLINNEPLSFSYKATEDLYVIALFYNGMSEEDKKSLQIEISDEPTTYEPYTEQTVQIALDEPLRGIVRINDGKNMQETLNSSGITRRFKRVEITKDTPITYTLGQYGAPETNTVICRYKDASLKKAGAILCGELKNINNWTADKESVSMTEQGIDFRLSRERLGLGSDTTPEENKVAVIKYLTDHPLHCVAELNVPTTEPLPESVQQQLQALHSENGTTHVFVDSGEVEAGINIEYKYKS